MRIAKLVSIMVLMYAALLFWLLGIAAPRAEAQLATGTVSGSVVDSTAAVVPGATINLISESRGTRLSAVTASSSGEFVVPNVPPDTYTLEIASHGFQTFQRTGIAVSPGDRVALGPLTIKVGAISQSITVSSEAPVLQTESADRSSTITSTEVQNLPLSNRNFTSLTAITPGISGLSRIADRSSSGGGDSNVMMDGISTMDTGNNGQMVAVNTESVAEVKLLVSDYQAEYGRSSGVQISAVTKSGTNQFHGTGFIVARQSGWNANSRTNKLNGDPRSYTKEKDLGFSIGGPIGKPGHNNKLFFFFADEFDPRSNAGTVTRYRVPTALERAGDFSQTTDNNGNPFPYIKDPLSNNPCKASNTSGCFQDGGVLGRIPANRLYGLGQKILGLYPLPNVSVPGAPYNFEIASPQQSLMSQAPVTKIDYQPWSKLRASFKLALWGQPNKTILGTLPGFNDSKLYKQWFYLWASTIDYTINPSTYLEATFGASRNDLGGCTQGAGSTAPLFCTNGLPMDKVASLPGAGLTGLPSVFPSTPLNKSYYAYQALNAVKPPIWDGTTLNMVPSFSWGGRIADAPPNFPFPGWLNTNQTHDVSISVTKVRGSHTLKAGFYWTHSYKAQQRQGWAGTIRFQNDTNNPLDSGFGYSNAVLGIFDQYEQLSKYVEGSYIYNNLEGYVQDNWKVTPRLTLDYGVRLVHQQPQYDRLGQAGNFLPDKWSLSSAPLLYVAGCAASPCTGANRQAEDPSTGKLLGPNTAVAIGTLVPGSGNALDGLFRSGQGPVPTTTYNWPTLRAEPRFGVAFNPNRRLVFRGGGGLFFDRPAGNSIYSQVQNPPELTDQTLYYSQLQTMGGLLTQGAPNLNVYQLNSGYPSTWTWGGGVQVMLGQQLIDVSYNGQDSYNLLDNPNINAVDFGAAFLPQNQDPTLSSSLPGGAAVTSNQMRAIRGYGGITQYQPRGWFVSHTLQFGISRRFNHGLSFGWNDTIVLQEAGSTGARYQHNPDGTFSIRADQAQADKLLGDYVPGRHTFKGYAVYAIPTFKNASSTPMDALRLVTKDWQLSGIWAANSPNTSNGNGTYAVGYSFQDGTGNTNITGSPDYGGRVRIVGNPGSGCSGNAYKEFNTAAFLPPLVGSVGLESGQDYMRGCFYQQFDIALQRDIRFGETRRLEFRVDAFNAFNQSHTTRINTSAQFASLTNNSIVNLPYDSSGNLIPTRSQPKNAGFGVANSYQGPRTLQMWLRFTF